MNEIIAKQDIINTYKKRQQEQCRLYKGYIKFKKENPNYGYKRIAKLLDQPYGKTRWWHAHKHIPVPIQTIIYLKKRNLIPLTKNHSKILLIAKILGALFGDGGIFSNLNGIFLSSSELEAVKEFGNDLEILFGNEIEKNSRIIAGGEYGHSWCYQNTNRKVIRFFMALGAPIGAKSLVNLKTPKWIKKSNLLIQDEFFGSLFGAELGVPKVHLQRNRLDTLSLGITGKDELEKNRIEFLNEVAKYLHNRKINTGKISINDHKKQNRKGEPTKIYKLLISTKFENMVNFLTLAKMNYCKYKPEKLIKTMNEFSEIKRQRFKELVSKGRKETTASKLLQLSPVSLYIIQNYESFSKI